MFKKKEPVVKPEVVETTKTKVKNVCSNCDDSGKSCVVCKAGDKVE